MLFRVQSCNYSYVCPESFRFALQLFQPPQNWTGRCVHMVQWSHLPGLQKAPSFPFGRGPLGPLVSCFPSISLFPSRTRVPFFLSSPSANTTILVNISQPIPSVGGLFFSDFFFICENGHTLHVKKWWKKLEKEAQIMWGWAWSQTWLLETSHFHF